jgi:DNA-binding transcriptional ArsR family regulator
MQIEKDVFRALADPTRRALFERLTRGEASVNELTARFTISQPAVSQHLAALLKAGLVCQRRDASDRRLVHYSVAPHGLRPLVDWVALYQSFWRESMDRLSEVLQDMDP